MPPGEEDRGRAFYAGVLGMTELPKPPVLAARGGAWFASGSVQLHLGVETDFRPAKKGPSCGSRGGYRRAGGFDRIRGVSVRWDDELPGYKRFYVEDPWGNRLELLEPTR